MTRDNLDEVVFDYLEGNLLPEEKEAFEFLINESEVISYEVKLWKNAYFSEALPSVSELENKLIISHGSDGGDSFINRIFLVLLTLSLFVLVNQYIHTSPLLSNDEQPVTNSSSNCLAVFPEAEEVKVMEQKYVASKSTPSKAPGIEPVPVETNTDIFTSLPIKWDKPFATNEFSVAKIQLKRTVELQTVNTVKPSNIKQLSRKEIRRINAKKRRDHQRKLETEFLKGNEPYVVPLKSNNF